MKISFVGSGNVAWHLAQALESAGHQVVEVYSRNSQHASQLVKKLYDTVVVSDLDFSESEANIIVLAVSDDAIQDVVSKTVFPENCIAVHTSGTKSLEEFDRLIAIHSDVAVRTGVFYPLQTFSRGVPISLANVPMCIEANDDDTEDALIDLAQDISNTVYLVNSDERKTLHLGAVFACNFTNHLLAVAKRIVENDDLEFELLKPLINETLRKALAAPDPAEVQTGPARRRDTKTMQSHQKMLKEEPLWQEIYRLMSQSIAEQ